jgi:broad specificity phosphatase PhoE
MAWTTGRTRVGNIWGRQTEDSRAARPRRLLLARHGASHRDVPLNEQGRAQAAALAERLDRETIDAVWTSDLSRARETAEIVCTRLGMTAGITTELREIDVGGWEGMRFEQIRESHPEAVAARERGEDIPRGGTGERVAEFQARVVSGLERAAATAPGGTLLLVVHGGVVKALVGHLLDVPLHNIGRITSGQNASLSEIKFGKGGPQLVRLNESHHADGISDTPPHDAV